MLNIIKTGFDTKVKIKKKILHDLFCSCVNPFVLVQSEVTVETFVTVSTFKRLHKTIALSYYNKSLTSIKVLF